MNHKKVIIPIQTEFEWVVTDQKRNLVHGSPFELPLPTGRDQHSSQTGTASLRLVIVWTLKSQDTFQTTSKLYFSLSRLLIEKRNGTKTSNVVVRFRVTMNKDRKSSMKSELHFRGLTRRPTFTVPGYILIRISVSRSEGLSDSKFC